jgi:hypothetical protein
VVSASVWRAVASWFPRLTDCVDRSCTDDSGPNLLVRAVEFLLLLALVTSIACTLRRLRTALRRDDVEDVDSPQLE